jgi:hypothetical protein
MLDITFLIQGRIALGEPTLKDGACASGVWSLSESNDLWSLEALPKEQATLISVLLTNDLLFII